MNANASQTPPTFEKCAVVIAEDLPPGLAMNGAAVLAVTLGRVFGEGIVGDDAKDGDGVAHRGLINVTLPILRAPEREVCGIVLGAHAIPELYVVDFSSVAQAARDYDTYLEDLAGAGTAQHTYVGVAVAGSKKAVNKLTGSLPLYR
jgi:hypothetical protein